MVRTFDDLDKSYHALKGTPFDTRHTDAMRMQWGAWRWHGMIEMANLIELLWYPGNKWLDIGGALGPIGLDSDIVDKRESIWGNRVYTDIYEAQCDYKLIYSSHFLEHVESIEPWINAFKQKLKSGHGNIILLLPDYRGGQWWHPINYNTCHDDKHYRLFTIDDMTHDSYACRIDTLLQDSGYNVLRKQYVGDNSIFIWGRI